MSAPASAKTGIKPPSKSSKNGNPLPVATNMITSKPMVAHTGTKPVVTKISTPVKKLTPSSTNKKRATPNLSTARSNQNDEITPSMLEQALSLIDSPRTSQGEEGDAQAVPPSPRRTIETPAKSPRAIPTIDVTRSKRMLPPDVSPRTTNPTGKLISPRALTSSVVKPNSTVRTKVTPTNVPTVPNTKVPAKKTLPTPAVRSVSSVPKIVVPTPRTTSVDAKSPRGIPSGIKRPVSTVSSVKASVPSTTRPSQTNGKATAQVALKDSTPHPSNGKSSTKIQAGNTTVRRTSGTASTGLVKPSITPPTTVPKIATSTLAVPKATTTAGVSPRRNSVGKSNISQKNPSPQKVSISGGQKRIAGPQGRKAPTNLKKLRENQAMIEQKAPADSPGTNNLRAKQAEFIASDMVKLRSTHEDLKVKPPTLIHLKGKRKVSVRVVECKLSSLNDGDSFILIDGHSIYQWIGKNASLLERSKGGDICRRICVKEMMTRGTVFTLDEKEGTDEHPQKFWKLLGATGSWPFKLNDQKAGGEDEDADKRIYPDILYKYATVKDKKEFKTVKYPKLTQSLLSHANIYVLDCSSESITSCTCGAEENQSHPIEETLWKEMRDKKNRPKWVHASREMDGAETILFKEKFFDFSDQLPIQSKVVESGLNVAVKKEETFKMSDMTSDHVTREVPPVDDGRANYKMWYVDSQSNPVEYTKRGHFFHSDSYVSLYTYKEVSKVLYEGSRTTPREGKDKHIIYFWQGKRSSHKEKGWSALITRDMGTDMAQNAPVQIRIPQQKETRHLLNIFGGNLFVHTGSCTDSDYPTWNSLPEGDQVYMYQLRGDPHHDLRLRISRNRGEASSRLDSNDSFLLYTRHRVYLWLGRFSSLSDKGETCVQICRLVRENIQEEIQVIDEGSEDDEFWEDINGACEYQREHRPNVKLFHCHYGTGAFDVYEVAIEYAEATKRRDTPISLVMSGLEPMDFISCFHSWDTRNARGCSSLNELEDIRATVASINRRYTLDELKTKPQGLDAGRLENYLSNEEFHEIFHMTKKEFAILPVWKRASLKKDAESLEDPEDSVSQIPGMTSSWTSRRPLSDPRCVCMSQRFSKVASRIQQQHRKPLYYLYDVRMSIDCSCCEVQGELARLQRQIEENYHLMASNWRRIQGWTLSSRAEEECKKEALKRMKQLAQREEYRRRNKWSPLLSMSRENLLCNTSSQ
ncbi:hypothetical protein PROFUN_10035 [Planoprotostelium fungivorum]|uniref:HP domain-containing protein n=1 Tax=Planoprotostelium fungivorum TaxID=1890364 RepID=A0A2P6NFG7_9EUKA|nr:hypothetical protein PROFUN_10035 [Planoprotostelium fungivorum]